MYSVFLTHSQPPSRSLDPGLKTPAGAQHTWTTNYTRGLSSCSKHILLLFSYKLYSKGAWIITRSSHIYEGASEEGRGTWRFLAVGLSDEPIERCLLCLLSRTKIEEIYEKEFWAKD